MTEVAPDFAEPFDGWRVWLVVESEGLLRLRSVVFNVVWPTRAPLAAECNRRRMNLLPWRRSALHDAPLAACDCGIYATTIERTAPYLDPRLDGPRVHRVLGRVSLWGTVIECAWGYRASAAYPAELFVPDGRGRDGMGAQDVAWALTEYGVPVELVDGIPPEQLVDTLSELRAA